MERVSLLCPLVFTLLTVAMPAFAEDGALLKKQRFAGTAHVDDVQLAPVQFEFSCHPASSGALSIEVVLTKDEKAGGFPLDRFEGPDGVGGERDLAEWSIDTRGDGVRVRGAISGWYGVDGDGFVFGRSQINRKPDAFGALVRAATESKRNGCVCRSLLPTAVCRCSSSCRSMDVRPRYARRWRPACADLVSVGPIGADPVGAGLRTQLPRSSPFHFRNQWIRSDRRVDPAVVPAFDACLAADVAFDPCTQRVGVAAFVDDALREIVRRILERDRAGLAVDRAELRRFAAAWLGDVVQRIAATLDTDEFEERFLAAVRAAHAGHEVLCRREPDLFGHAAVVFRAPVAREPLRQFGGESGRTCRGEREECADDEAHGVLPENCGGA